MADLKELKKLVAFMRKTGVIEYKSGEIELKLSLEAPVKKPRGRMEHIANDLDEIDTDGPTQSELLFWSAGGASADEDV